MESWRGAKEYELRNNVVLVRAGLCGEIRIKQGISNYTFLWLFRGTILQLCFHFENIRNNKGSTVIFFLHEIVIWFECTSFNGCIPSSAFTKPCHNCLIKCHGNLSCKNLTMTFIGRNNILECFGISSCEYTLNPFHYIILAQTTRLLLLGKD